ncbi:MAG: methionine biosynthesis protein MetW [Bauldia sp.]|nr:methionine biosynthesis protein MetW [Bauldia sp.]
MAANGNGTAAITARRVDLAVVAELIPPGSKVLDVGCGNGDLLVLLEAKGGVVGRGLEISQKGVNECVARGLSVIQGDADRDLVHYPDDAFDTVILSQTLQATYRPRAVLEELLRIGRRVVVSFPNFGYWRVRASLGLRGRMPMTPQLPSRWYDTPNIHFFTIRDFVELCAEIGATVEQAVAFNSKGERLGLRGPGALWNFFGAQAVFLIRR